MLRWKKSPGLLFLVAYLCLFFCFLLPVKSEGALLQSSPSGEMSGAEQMVAERLSTLGLSRAEAEEILIAYREAGILPAAMILQAGGSPPRDYDPPINNVALVLVICCVVAGIGIAIGTR